MAEITQELCQHVLWFYGYEGGLQPGSFTQNLMRTITLADPINKGKLARGFPEYVAALELPLPLLQAIAAGEK